MHGITVSRTEQIKGAPVPDGLTGSLSDAYRHIMHGMDLIRPVRGLISRIARELGVNRSAVAMWRRIPAERVLAVEHITGIPRHFLRPDLYVDKQPRVADAMTARTPGQTHKAPP